MSLALGWFVVVALLALWSLASWVLHGIAVWTVSNAGTLTGAASDAVGAVRLPEALAPWLPPEIASALHQLLAGVGPAVDSLLRAAPALADVVTVAAWLVWGLGSVLILLMGAGLHLLLAWWRRSGRRGAASGAGPSPVAC